MRYFTFELLAAANDWVEQSEAEQKEAEARFAKAEREYWQQLEGLESRISRAVPQAGVSEETAEASL